MVSRKDFEYGDVVHFVYHDKLRCGRVVKVETSFVCLSTTISNTITYKSYKYDGISNLKVLEKA